MSKELVEQLVQSMVDEATRQGNWDTMDRVTIDVLRRHIADLGSRQASLREISLAISEALGELWWSAGTEGKNKIRKVKELSLKIRNEDAIIVETVIRASPDKPHGDRAKSIVRKNHK